MKKLALVPLVLAVLVGPATIVGAPGHPAFAPALPAAAADEGPRAPSAGSGWGDERPNVVLIVADTLRADALSTYGYERPTAPRLDEFAKKSLVFENAISVGASTPPSLSALMTGRLPYYEPSSFWSSTSAHGMRRFYRDGEQAGLPVSLDTLAERFRAVGYRTMGIVTNAYVKRVYRFDQGFDEFVEIFNDGRPHYGTAEQVTERALAFLRQDRDGPIFLYVHYMDPHVPYVPPEPYRSEFQGDGEGSRTGQRNSYDASIRYMDESIGRLLDTLSKAPYGGHTIVAFVSDHGEEFGDHGSQGHTGTLFEELVRVPMILHGPTVSPGRTQALVRNFDVGPTLLELARVAGADDDADAVSLVPLLREGASAEPLAAVASFPLMRHGIGPEHRPARRMIREDRYKLIDNLAAPDQSELFDLENDPKETRNIYDDRPDVAARMRGAIEALASKLEREDASALSSEPAAVRIDGRSRFGGLRGANRSHSRVRGPLLRLYSKKKAPTLELPYFRVPEGGSVHVQVELIPSKRPPRLLFRTVQDPKFRLERAIPGQISEDGARAEFELKAPGVVGPVRLQFGDQPGEVDIRSVTLSSSREGLSTDRNPEHTGFAGGIDVKTRDQLRALGYVE